MDIRITKAPAGGTIPAIPSKSAAHRIMIAAALSGLPLTQNLEGLSLDITATKECLEALFSRDRGHAPASLCCGESGSTLRFLLPVAGALGVDADLHCEGRLPDRPMEPFLEALAEHGCTVTGRTPKMIRGKLKPGTYRLPGNVSSQYVTGLLFALPLLEGDSRILVEGTLQSRPYIDLTLDVLAKAGIQVCEKTFGQGQKLAAEADGAETEGPGTVFEIRGGQKYMLPAEELDRIEGDWSNGAFWIVMDAMNRRMGAGEITCTGLDPASRQGDRAIVELIRRMEQADRNSAADGQGRRVEIDVSDIPDLVPAISAYACGRPAGAVTHIVGAERLRFKESDRLRAVTEILSGLGADITEEPAGLMIRGTKTLSGGEADSFGDHRIVMMAAAAACIAEQDIIIRGAEAVNKSYPGFFEDYRKLGGEVRELSEE